MPGWEYKEVKFDGSCKVVQAVEEIGQGMAAGIAKLKADPEKYESIMYQNDVGDDVEYTLFLRGSGVSAKPTGGSFTLVTTSFKALGPATFSDDVSDKLVSYQGAQHELKRIGRGEGLLDVPGLKLFGDIDPADLVQASETY